MSWVVLLLLSLVEMDIVSQLMGVELFFLQRVRTPWHTWQWYTIWFAAHMGSCRTRPRERQ